MASKVAFAALVLLVLLAGEVASAQGVQIGRGLSLGWNNETTGGSPTGEEGNRSVAGEEAIFTVPAFVRPPRLPPS
uniref:Uncharacterized protein n=1 Tax=Oryza meridionalis TaxID=40149 RepID=A0A0E0C2Z0_9ORYZ